MNLNLSGMALKLGHISTEETESNIRKNYSKERHQKVEWEKGQHLPKITELNLVATPNSFREYQFMLLPHLPSQHILVIIYNIIAVLASEPFWHSDASTPDELSPLMNGPEQHTLLHIPWTKHWNRATHQQGLTPLGKIRYPKDYFHRIHRLIRRKQSWIHHIFQEGNWQSKKHLISGQK